jgi:hypothetical protein
VFPWSLLLGLALCLEKLSGRVPCGGVERNRRHDRIMHRIRRADCDSCQVVWGFYYAQYNVKVAFLHECACPCVWSVHGTHARFSRHLSCNVKQPTYYKYLQVLRIQI